MAGRVDFNFNTEQQEKFNKIYAETKRIHPELTADNVGKERVKVLIAYTIINGDVPLVKKDNFDNVFEEITKEEINEIKK
jgi:hypothetical protein